MLSVYSLFATKRKRNTDQVLIKVPGMVLKNALATVCGCVYADAFELIISARIISNEDEREIGYYFSPLRGHPFYRGPDHFAKYRV